MHEKHAHFCDLVDFPPIYSFFSIIRFIFYFFSMLFVDGCKVDGYYLNMYNGRIGSISTKLYNECMDAPSTEK